MARLKKHPWRKIAPSNTNAGFLLTRESFDLLSDQIESIGTLVDNPSTPAIDYGATLISVNDSLFSIFDNTTPTKIAQFQASTLPVGTSTFNFPPLAAAGTDTLAALGLAQTWGALQTFPDNTLAVVGSSDSSKKLVFELDTALTGTTLTAKYVTSNSRTLWWNLSGAGGNNLTLDWTGTASRIVNIPDADTMLAGLAVTETFTAPNTFQSTVGTSVTANPSNPGAPTGGGGAIATSFADSNWGAGAAPTGVWLMNASLSDATNTIGDNTLLSLTGTAANMSGAIFRGGLWSVTGSMDAAGANSSVYGLDFVATADGNSGNTFTSIFAAKAQVVQSSVDPITTMRCFSAQITSGASKGTVTTAEAFGVASWTVSTGTTFTSGYCFRGLNPTGSGTLTTLYGLFLPNLTKGGTNWAIFSQGGQSSHVGNFRLGDNTAPTALLDLVGKLTASSSGVITKYNNVTTAGGGVGAIYGNVDLTAQAAAIGATTLASTAGKYVVHYTIEDTTGDVTAGTIQFQINYTDDIGATNQTGAALALTATGRDRGSFVVYMASGNLQYQTNLVGIIGTARYALRVSAVYHG